MSRVRLHLKQFLEYIIDPAVSDGVCLLETTFSVISLLVCETLNYFNG